MSCHRKRIFSLSIGDWLDPEVPVEWLARMLDTIRQCSEVRWLLLTKRPELWLARMSGVCNDLQHDSESEFFDNRDDAELYIWLLRWLQGNAPSHVFIGTSVEDQQRADERIPHLLRIPAAGRFLSLEPLLGPVDFYATSASWPSDGHPWSNGPILQGINQIIIGGESGAKARPCNVEWIRSLVQQGREAGVPTFVSNVELAQNDWTFPIADSITAISERELSNAVMQECSCGGGGPDDKHTCPACQVYHRLVTLRQNTQRSDRHET